MTSRVAVWKLLAGTIAACLAGSVQAAHWQAMLTDAGRRMELDRASIKKADGDKIVAWARILFDKPVADTASGGTYRVIEALNRYDCNVRTFTTLKRVYRKDENEILREEENKTPVDLPVRSGTIDEKILKIVCRPGGLAGVRQDFDKVVQAANEAAAEMRQANEATVSQAVKKDARKEVKKEILKADLAERKTGTVAKNAAAPAARPRPTGRATARAVARHPTAEPTADIPWAYDGAGGPDFWAKLKSEYRLCGAGQRQSPIDLREAIRVDQPAIEFRYKPSLFRIADTDHAVEVAVVDSGITLLGKAYRLNRIRFHRPGEHRVDGREFEMSAHLEHRADDGQVAMVAINLVAGREHPVVQTLWNHLPLERYEVVSPPAASLDLDQLLPAKRGYFHYMGSLTAPPCSENVVWLVMQQPVEISAEQIAIFAQLHANNARPLQAASGRRVKASR